MQFKNVSFVTTYRCQRCQEQPIKKNVCTKTELYFLIIYFYMYTETVQQIYRAINRCFSLIHFSK